MFVLFVYNVDQIRHDINIYYFDTGIPPIRQFERERVEKRWQIRHLDLESSEKKPTCLLLIVILTPFIA